MNTPEWNKRASNFLKAELKRCGVGYDELQKKLAELDVEETANGINSKINRGTFSFAFFLQVMKALNLKVVRLESE